MKRLVHWLLMPLLVVGFATSCDLINTGEEDNGGNDGGDGGQDYPTITTELQLERQSVIASAGETIRVGFDMHVTQYEYDEDDNRVETTPNDIEFDYWAETDRTDIYSVEVERIDNTSGTIVITSSGEFYIGEYAEVTLYAKNVELDVVCATANLILEPTTYELYEAPNDNTFVLGPDPTTIDVKILANTQQVKPLDVNSDWVHYDPSKVEIEQLNDVYYIQHHKLTVDAHTQGNDPREEYIYFRQGLNTEAIEIRIHQEVNFAADGREMIFRVRAVAGNAQTVYLPVDEVVKCTVDWGDGTQEIYENKFTSNNPIQHVYAEAGEYLVTVRGQVKKIDAMCLPLASRDNTIIAIEQWGNVGAEEISLSWLGSIERVAPDTEGAFAHIEIFDRTFAGCKRLTEIPADLFAKATSAHSFVLTFYQCTSLRTLPDGLFEVANPSIFENTFDECTALTELPEGLFRGCTGTQMFHRTFENCTGLTSLPANLFADCTNVTRFKGTFHGCSGLTSIPAGLFANNTKVTSFEGEMVPFEGLDYREYKGLFGECTSLTTIPEQLFANCPDVTNCSMAFLGCSNLQSVPAKLFAHNPALTNLYKVFEECTSLTALPEGLLDANPKLSDIERMCYGCTALTTVPTNLFDNNRLLYECKQAFSSCTALQGESPYTEIDGKKYHLYERSTNPTEFTSPDGKFCFSGCKNLTDYQNIPEEWK